jgi:hypothetical protein
LYLKIADSLKTKSQIFWGVESAAQLGIFVEEARGSKSHDVVSLKPLTLNLPRSRHAQFCLCGVKSNSHPPTPLPISLPIPPPIPHLFPPEENHGHSLLSPAFHLKSSTVSNTDYSLAAKEEGRREDRDKKVKQHTVHYAQPSPPCDEAHAKSPPGPVPYSIKGEQNSLPSPILHVMVLIFILVGG